MFSEPNSVANPPLFDAPGQMPPSTPLTRPSKSVLRYKMHIIINRNIANSSAKNLKKALRSEMYLGIDPKCPGLGWR